MAEEGARMAFCGRRSESGRALESYCLARGLQVKYIEADVTDLSSNKMLIDEIVKTYGRIDILVPNAGGGSENKMLDTMPNGQWLHDMAIFIHSPMLLSKYAIRYIIKQGSGESIIMMSSASPCKLYSPQGGMTQEKAQIGILQNR